MSLRFPMTLLVVYIHSSVTGLSTQASDMGGVNSVCQIVKEFVSHGICACAVPLFFLLSGWLFFANVKEWSIQTYCGKIRGRIRSLIVPYVFWNTGLLVFTFAVQTLLPQMTSGKHMLVSNYGLYDYLMAYWDLGDGFPACGPMWFVRNLFVYSLLTIIIYPLMRRYWLGMAILAVLFVFNPFGGAFYFAAGVWLVLNNVDFIRICKKMGKWLVAPYIVILVVMTEKQLSGNISVPWDSYLKELSVVMGMVIIIWLIGTLYESREISRCTRFLADSSFFVYAFHQAPLLMVDKLFVKYVSNTTIVLLAGYFLLPLLLVTVSLTLYWLIRRYSPILLTLTTGGR